jgi:hypothetical protein
MSTLQHHLALAERHVLADAVARYPTRREAAAALGISLRTLFYKLKRANLPALPRYSSSDHPEFAAGVEAAAQEVDRLPLREDIRELVTRAIRTAPYSR